MRDLFFTNKKAYVLFRYSIIKDLHVYIMLDYCDFKPESVIRYNLDKDLIKATLITTKLENVTIHYTKTSPRRGSYKTITEREFLKFLDEIELYE